MPWRESSPMSERFAFIQACLNRREPIVAICDRMGISEKTGQKWLRRVRLDGIQGLEDRSHARHTHPHQVRAEVTARIIALRRQHPLYGAKLLHDWLCLHEPTGCWPAASTIGVIITRAGLVRRRRRRPSVTHRAFAGGRTHAPAPNVVWTADFKGQVRLGGGATCFPLTVLDLHSHYLLGCTALPSTAIVSARTTFTTLFREYGLPEVMRTDNGVPFAQPNAIGRLGQLAFWWVRLGIRPEHIKPATPAENGAHERFHRTLKAHTLRPVRATFAAQQRCFNAFREEYNSERPHSSVAAHQPPARIYTVSPRPFPRRLPPLCYPDASAVRRVSAAGSIKWHRHVLSLSSNLAGDFVGLTETDTDLVEIAYGDLILGDFDPHLERFVANVRWRR